MPRRLPEPVRSAYLLRPDYCAGAAHISFVDVMELAWHDGVVGGCVCAVCVLCVCCVCVAYRYRPDSNEDSKASLSPCSPVPLRRGGHRSDVHISRTHHVPLHSAEALMHNYAT